MVRHSQQNFDKDGFRLGPALAILAFGCFGAMFVMLIKSYNKFSDDQWERPSWFINPANPRQPIQALHLSAWCFIVMGIAVGLFTLALGLHTLIFTFPLCIGFAFYAGVWLSVFILKDKFAPAPE